MTKFILCCLISSIILIIINLLGLNSDYIYKLYINNQEVECYGEIEELSMQCNEIKNNIYTREGIKRLYTIETNAYLKVQLFREMNEILSHNEVKITQMDSAWYKFIDETYHIENDYLHFLDIIKFNIVPSYIIDNMDEIVYRL